jgi:hypothetical protein
MAYELVFKSVPDEKVEAQLIVRANQYNNIFIEIDMFDHPPAFIQLDKETSIKLAKELRKQISFLED